MNACAQIADAEMTRKGLMGSGTFGAYLHDAIFTITEETAKGLVSYEILP